MVVAPAAAVAGVVSGSRGGGEVVEWCECDGCAGVVFLSPDVFPVEESELYRRCGRAWRNTWGWDLGVIGRQSVEVEDEALDKRPFRRGVMSKTTSIIYKMRIVQYST